MNNSIFANNNSNISKSVKVEIYSTAYCPYCTRARMLLDSKGVPYTEIRVDQDISLRSEMERRSNRTSVPQIFIGNRHIGGFDDLAELEFGEELDAILGLS
ncbi:glutaredoxin 3 [Kaarinaea lacus]